MSRNENLAAINHEDQPLTWAGEFANPQWERRYQEHAWPEVSRLIRLSAIFGGFMFALAGLADYLVMGAGWPLIFCVSTRLAAGCVAILAWAVARRKEFSPLVSWTVLALELAMGLALMVVTIHKTTAVITLPLTVLIMVLIFYVVPPVRLPFLLTGGVSVSVAFLTVFSLANRDADLNFILITALLMVLVNVFGAFLVTRQGALRRRSFFHLRHLQEMESKYRLVVENAVEGIIITSESRVLYANPWVEHGLGLPLSRLVNRPLSEFLHPDDREGVLDSHTRRMAQRNTSGIKRFRATAQDGRVLWLEASGVFVQWEGQPAALYFLNDITQRIVGEEQERQRQKIEAAIQTAGAACHELNQPLQTVLMQAELIMMSLDAEHPLHRRLGKILEAADQMARVTQRLNRITSFHTKVYVGDEMILDLELSTSKNETRP